MHGLVFFFQFYSMSIQARWSVPNHYFIRVWEFLRVGLAQNLLSSVTTLFQSAERVCENNQIRSLVTALFNWYQIQTVSKNPVVSVLCRPWPFIVAPSIMPSRYSCSSNARSHISWTNYPFVAFLIAKKSVERFFMPFNVFCEYLYTSLRLVKLFCRKFALFRDL